MSVCRSVVSFLLCGSIIIPFPAVAETPAEAVDYMAACDFLASSPEDVDRLDVKAKRNYRPQDLDDALTTCFEAAKRYPLNARTRFQLARALQKTGRDPKTAAVFYREAAEAGSADALKGLGLALAQAQGVAGSAEEATEYYRRSAAGGNVDAMFFLAAALDSHDNSEADKAEALSLFERAAERGQAYAMISYANKFACILCGPTYGPTMYKWHRAAAAAGNIVALGLVGDDLFWGRGVARNIAESATWFKRGAEAGNPHAMTYYALSLMPTGPSAGNLWMQRAAQAGDNAAIAYLREDSTPSQQPMTAERRSTPGQQMGALFGILGLGIGAALLSAARPENWTLEGPHDPFRPECLRSEFRYANQEYCQNQYLK